MNIIIPSYKRADCLAGIEYFGEVAKWCIPKSQEVDYLKVLKQEQILSIPDEDDGSIVKKRNWILKNIARPLVMIDDDVKSIEYLEQRKEFHCDYRVLPKEQLLRFFQQGFDLAEGFHTALWGIYFKTDSREYKEFQPFSLSNIILGPFQCHSEHDLLFDERMGTKEDYDMSLQMLNKYKMVLRLNKFAYRCSHGDNKGGIVSYRTMEKEIGWCRAIEKKWGRNVISYPREIKKQAELLNGKVQVPIQGV